MNELYSMIHHSSGDHTGGSPRDIGEGDPLYWSLRGAMGLEEGEVLVEEFNHRDTITVHYVD